MQFLYIGWGTRFLIFMHCKKIGGWFNSKRVISVPVWIHPGPGGGPLPFCKGLVLLGTHLFQWSFLVNNERIGLQMKFILWLHLKGCNSCYIHVLLDGLWRLFMHWLTWVFLCFMQIFMPYWNIEYTKALTLHCGKSGRWYRSCNWGNPFWVKLTSSFLQCIESWMAL